MLRRSRTTPNKAESHGADQPVFPDTDRPDNPNGLYESEPSRLVMDNILPIQRERRSWRPATPPSHQRGSILKERSQTDATTAARTLENDILSEYAETDYVEGLLVQLQALQVRLAAAHDRQVNELHGEIMRLKEIKGESDRTAGSTPPPITSKACESLMVGHNELRRCSNLDVAMDVNELRRMSQRGSGVRSCGPSPRATPQTSPQASPRPTPQPTPNATPDLSDKQQSKPKARPVKKNLRRASAPNVHSLADEFRRSRAPDGAGEDLGSCRSSPSANRMINKSKSIPLRNLENIVEDDGSPGNTGNAGDKTQFVDTELIGDNADRSTSKSNIEAWVNTSPDTEEIKQEDESSDKFGGSTDDETDLEVARVCSKVGLDYDATDQDKNIQDDESTSPTKSLEILPVRRLSRDEERRRSAKNEDRRRSAKDEERRRSAKDEDRPPECNDDSSEDNVSLKSGSSSSHEVSARGPRSSEGEDDCDRAEHHSMRQSGMRQSGRAKGRSRQEDGQLNLPGCAGSEDDQDDEIDDMMDHMPTSKSLLAELPNYDTFQVGGKRAQSRLSLTSNGSLCLPPRSETIHQAGEVNRLSLTLPHSPKHDQFSHAEDFFHQRMSMGRTSLTSHMTRCTSMRSNGSVCVGKRPSVRAVGSAVRFSAMPQAGESLQPYECWFDIMEHMQHLDPQHQMRNVRRRAQTIDRDMQLRLRSKTANFLRVANEDNIGAKCLQMLVHTPNHPLRVIWVLLSMLLIFYDVVMIPLGVYDMDMEEVIEVMTYTSAGFWTMDLIMSFFVGYHDQFTLEMRFRNTCLHYAKTWLPMDLSLVAIDWLVITAEQVIGGQFRTMRAAKTVYAMRTYRALRLLRIAKLPEKMKEFSMYIGRSEYTSLLAGIVKHMSLILLINHLIACSWYLLGKGSDPGWVKFYLEDDDGWVISYLTSLHWSLTQFTPATMSVQPQNLAERAMAVSVLLFAMVSFSSFVSSITNLMNHLRSLRAAEAKAFLKLDRYLHDHHISFHLSLKVRRYLDNLIAVQRRNVSEKDVELIARLSDPLRMELHYEVYCTSITKHPFFKHYESTNLTAMQKLCHMAVRSIRLSRDDVLFSNGESAKASYFLTTGTLKYTRQLQQEDLEEDVECGQVVCEMVLWTPWEHRGNLRARTESNLVSLDAVTFHEVVLDNKHGAVETANYAIQAVAKMNECFLDPSDYTDLEGLGYDPISMCDELFNSGRDVTGKRSIGGGAWIRRMTSSMQDRKDSVHSVKSPERTSSVNEEDSVSCEATIKPVTAVSSGSSNQSPDGSEGSNSGTQSSLKSGEVKGSNRPSISLTPVGMASKAPLIVLPKLP